MISWTSFTSSSDPLLQKTARLSNRWWVPFVCLATVILCIPFINTVYWMGDEGVLLHGAERMLRGNRLYTDFFEFLPPGSFVLTEAWLSIAGISLWSARLLAISVIAGIACFTYLACWQASKNAPLSALLVSGWVVMSQGVWTQVSHHWLTTLFSMITAWAVFSALNEHPPRQLRWPMIAGLAAGIAAMVTPTRGALAMLVAVTAFLNLRHKAELIAYVLASALVPAGLLAYVAAHHALAAEFDDVIRFAAQRYASIQNVPFGSLVTYRNFPLKYLFPLAAVLTLVVCARDWRTCGRDYLLRSCAAFGIAGFVGCFPRPDMVHIGFAAPLAGPLLARCATQLSQPWRPAYRYIVAAAMIAVCTPSALSFSWMYQRALRGDIVQTPRGGVTFFGQPGIRELLARIAATPSSDTYFFYPYMPMLPFLTAREQASKYDIFTPGYTLPPEYRDACVSAMRHASWVVIDRQWTDPKFLKALFPAMQDPEPPETRAFEKALNSGFEFVEKDGSFELLRRREGINETVCANIAE
jgi:hypothetical protein